MFGFVIKISQYFESFLYFPSETGKYLPTGIIRMSALEMSLGIVHKSLAYVKHTATTEEGRENTLIYYNNEEFYQNCTKRVYADGKINPIF